MNQVKASGSIRNHIRFSLLLLIFPVIYLGTWFSISSEHSLSYFGKVQLLMSYFPETMRDPYAISLIFFGMSLGAACLSFFGYLKSTSNNARYATVLICCVATLLSAWFGMALL